MKQKQEAFLGFKIGQTVECESEVEFGKKTLIVGTVVSDGPEHCTLKFADGTFIHLDKY